MGSQRLMSIAACLALAVGCSRGIYEPAPSGGLDNHLGDPPASTPGSSGGDTGGATGGIPGGDTGGIPGGSTGGGLCGTGESTGDATLDACLEASCCSAFSACYADATCQACLYDSSGAACGSSGLFLAFDGCWADFCDTTGGGGTTPTGGGVCGSGESTGDSTTDACLDSYCCSAFDACYSNATCQACLYDSTGAACGSDSRFLAFDGCWTDYCDSGSGGGTTPTGGGVCGSGLSSGDASYDDCINSYCCSAFTACYNDAACSVCLGDPSQSSCSYDSLYWDFDDCTYFSC
jgi:hypothetical protein